MTVTIKDVAARAGVSYQTVSRALNHPEAVSPSTLDRVRSAMDTLQWVPSPMARALQAARLTGTPSDADASDR